MALVTRYVNTASAGGDGTTNAESGANAAYASLNAWEAAEAVDLVTAGDSHIVYCSTGSGTAADTTGVTISGWITDSTHTVTIQQATSDAHGGKWNTSVYRLELSEGTALTIREDYVSIVGLQVHVTTAAASVYGISIGSLGVSNSIIISKCIVRGTVSATGIANGISSASTYTNLKIYQNLVYDFVNGSNFMIGIYLRNASASALSNLVYNCYVGIRSRDIGVIAKNNIVRSSVSTGYLGSAAFDASSDYNSSDISGDAPNTGGSGNDNTVSPWYSGATADADIFVDAVNDDYHLVSGATIFDSVGANLYSTFTDDFEGDARPNSAFDLGADEYVASGTVYNESISLSASVALTKSAGLILDESVALSTAAGMTPENNNVLNLALSLTASAEILQSPIMDIMESIGLAASAGITPLATLIMSAAATLAATAGMSQEGVVPGGGTIYEEAIALATSAGMTPEIALSINGALALSASAGITHALTMAIESNLSLQTAAAMNQDNALDINESVSLAALTSQIQSSTWNGNVSLVLSVAAHMIQLGLVGDAVVFAHEAVLNLAGSKSDLNLVKSKHDLEN